MPGAPPPTTIPTATHPPTCTVKLHTKAKLLPPDGLHNGAAPLAAACCNQLRSWAASSTC